jgi:hypothetical protein
MPTKDTLAAWRKIRFVEGALAKLECELENAEGSHREVLQKCVAVVQLTLKTLRRHTVH